MSSVDGPLVSASMAGQNKSAAAGEAITDAWNTGNFALEPASAESDVEEAIDIDSSSPHGEDGPLLFALLLNNQNNNNNKNIIGETGDPISDTLNPISIGLELKYLDNMNGVSRSFNKGDGYSVSPNENLHSEDAITEAIPDVLKMKTQLLELHSSDAITEAISDMLGMKTQLLELHSPDAITEAIPDVMEMKTQLLELHSPENTITNGIPVILKLNSQAQAAQIKALLQGQSIPVAISTKNIFEKNTSKSSSNGAPIIGSIMQPRENFTVDESKKGDLSDEQLQFWKENGYLVIPNALPIEQKDLLLKTVHESAGALASGGERVEKHSYLPGQKSYVHPCGRAIATLSDSGEIGARVVPHQDGYSGFTNPSSCTTFWYALEDCSLENGCLAVAPGSHRTQPITRRCRNVLGKPEFVELECPVYAQVEGVRDESLPRRDESGELVYEKLEVRAGTLVLMHWNLMHMSEANKSTKSRVAFNFGVVEGELEWLEDNYLQPYEGETEFEKL